MKFYTKLYYITQVSMSGQGYFRLKETNKLNDCKKVTNVAKMLEGICTCRRVQML